MGLLDRFSRPPSKEQFARSMMEAFGKIHNRGAATYDEDEFRLTFTKDGEETGTIYLANLYVEYCNRPKSERAEFIRRTCLLAREFEIPDDFEDVKPDLLPSVRVRSTEEVMQLDAELAGGNWSPLATLPLSEHLELWLVYDLPDSMHFVNQETLERWGVGSFEAFEIAKQNLLEREFQIGSIGENLFFVLAGDAYDATRIILLDQIRALPLAGQPVAMAVNRETLLLTGSDDGDGLGMMADLAEKKEDEARPLCTIPHILSDEWSAWLPPDDHPEYERFRVLSLKHYYRDYSEQKSLFEKRHEQTGQEVFVATFSVVERFGKLVSCCVLTNGVPTFLPQTDYVAFYDGERQKRWIVPRERFDDVAGEMLKPLAYYPPRSFIESFPTDDQIERMGTVDWPDG